MLQKKKKNVLVNDVGKKISQKIISTYFYSQFNSFNKTKIWPSIFCFTRITNILYNFSFNSWLLTYNIGSVISSQTKSSQLLLCIGKNTLNIFKIFFFDIKLLFWTKLNMDLNIVLKYRKLGFTKKKKNCSK